VLARPAQRDDLFTVVLEQFQNDTADYADFLLPATTFLEHTDLYLRLRPLLPATGAARALAPPGETQIERGSFSRNSPSRMGFDDACFGDSDDDMIRTLLDSDHPFVRGITLEDYWTATALCAPAWSAPAGDPFLPFANGGFGTPSGKCDFPRGVHRTTRRPWNRGIGDESLRRAVSRWS
jgi:anaerobic selenocysteine-containing dehydrogenase